VRPYRGNVGGRDEVPKGAVVGGSSPRRMWRRAFGGSKGPWNPDPARRGGLRYSSGAERPCQNGRSGGQSPYANAKPGSAARNKVPNSRPAREPGRCGGREPSWCWWEGSRSGVAPCERPAMVGGVGTAEWRAVPREMPPGRGNPVKRRHWSGTRGRREARRVDERRTLAVARRG